MQPQTLYDVLKDRRSINLRDLLPDPIALTCLAQMLEAANWAPSHGHTEPWRFTVFTGEARHKLGEVFAEAYRLLTPAERFDAAVMAFTRDRILQVLANLLGNAIKFCKAGDAVTLRAEARDKEVLVSVIDTGPGIPENELPNIFEAYRTFERAGDATRGTGLGLYIAKGIVERHRGRLWVESEVGVGTTFSFTLPRA